VKTRLLLALGVLTLAFSPAVSAQQDIGALTGALGSFVDKTPGSLPFAAGAGIDWSNAYIGQLIDTDFPFVHLGAGLSVGFTTLPGDAVKPLITTLGGALPSGMDYIPLPYAVANARIGGLLLPFDIGLKAGFLPSSLQTVGDYGFTYNNFGIDARFNLIKSDLLMPDISVGGGINYFKAGVTYTIGQGQQFADPTGTGYKLNVGAPVLAMNMNALSFEAKAQVSKTFLYLLTPYIGATASYGTGHADAGITANVTSSNGNDLAYWQNKFGINATSAGITIAKDATPFGLKIYGGTSLNILIIKVDAQAMYNLLDGSIGLSAGLRAQL
jgi:opacity protein-like surface antigen